MCDRVEQGQRWQSFHFVTGIISLWRLCPHCVDPLFPPPPTPQPCALSIFIDNVSHGRRLPPNPPPSRLPTSSPTSSPTPEHLRFSIIHCSSSRSLSSPPPSNIFHVQDGAPTSSQTARMTWIFYLFILFFFRESFISFSFFIPSFRWLSVKSCVSLCGFLKLRGVSAGFSSCFFLFYYSCLTAEKKIYCKNKKK